MRKDSLARGQATETIKVWDSGAGSHIRFFCTNRYFGYRTYSEMGVSRYVERNSAFGVAVRPSRAAIPPGGMPPGEYRLSLGGRRCCHSFTYLVFL
jgi:hypothetical protein